MQQEGSTLAPYAARLTLLWERMVRAVGIHTVNVLLERAVWEVSPKHPELALIKRTDEGLLFDAIATAYADQPKGEAREAFDNLNVQLLVILARLLGREMAERLGEELGPGEPEAS